MPPPAAAWLSLLLALLLAGRFFFWKPQLALRRIDLGPFLLAGALALALVQALISALLLRRDDAAGANAHVS